MGRYKVRIVSRVEVEAKDEAAAFERALESVAWHAEVLDISVTEVEGEDGEV